MARKKKTELIEEARSLGLPAHDDEHYDDILARIKAEREAEESSDPVDFEDLDPDDEDEGDEDEVFIEPEPVGDLVAPRSRGWSKLGVWQGGGRPQ